jgi:TonB family protein
MTRIVPRLGAVILVIVTVVDAQDPSKVLEQQAKSQVGKTATLCGTVVEYQCERPKRISLLPLDGPLAGAGVSVAIAPENRGKFGLLFEPRHVLLNLCATGPIEKRKNRYVVNVTDPSQVQAQSGPSSAVTFPADTVSACDEGVELPKLVRAVKPAYPRAAQNARIEGVVLLEAVVLANGQVGNIRVLRSLDSTFGLDDEALTALKAWRFSPGTLRGRVVPVVVTVELSFRRS